MKAIDDFNSELHRLSVRLDEAQKELEAANSDWAVKEDMYRRQKAQTYISEQARASEKSEKITVDTLKALVDLASGKERLACHLAEGLKVSTLEAVRNIRCQITALQTAMNCWKAEMENLKTPEPSNAHQEDSRQWEKEYMLRGQQQCESNSVPRLVTSAKNERLPPDEYFVEENPDDPDFIPF